MTNLLKGNQLPLHHNNQASLNEFYKNWIKQMLDLINGHESDYFVALRLENYFAFFAQKCRNK